MFSRGLQEYRDMGQSRGYRIGKDSPLLRDWQSSKPAYKMSLFNAIRMLPSPRSVHGPMAQYMGGCHCHGPRAPMCKSMMRLIGANADVVDKSGS